MSNDTVIASKLFDKVGMGFSDDDTITPIEKKTAVLTPKHFDTVYTVFKNEFSTYLSKIPNSLLKTYVKEVYDKNLIYLSIDTNSKNLVYGSLGILDKKLAAIFLDVKDLEIDSETGESSRIDDVIYMTYFQFIRAATIINFESIKNNDELHKIPISYLSILFIRMLKLPADEKSKALIIGLISYMYFRFMLNDNRALDKMTLYVPENQKGYVIEKTSKRSHLLSKYKKFRDVLSAFIDFNLTINSPNELIMTMIKSIKLNNFLYLTTNIDYLFASIIVSNYPITILSNLNITPQLQSKFETTFSEYFKNVNFDSKTSADFFS